MTQVPDALEGFTKSLRHGLAADRIAARRQALVCAEQAATLGGMESTGAPYFARLAASAPQDDALAARLTRGGARLATEAYAAMAPFPARGVRAASSRNRCRRRRELYAIGVRRFLGTNRDPEEMYAWGMGGAASHRGRDGRTAERIAPGAGLDAAMALLSEDPARGIKGIDNLLAYLQELTDRTIAELDGTHFDIPEPLHRIECREAPPGTAAAMYYTPPSADFSRPGRTWYPAKETDPLPPLDRGDDRVSRGRSRAPPPGGALHDVPGPADELPAPAGLLLRPRRGLGALRGAADGGARLSREPRLPARDARLAGISRDARDRRHRACTSSFRSRRPRRTTRARSGTGRSRCPSSAATAASPALDSRAASSTATAGCPRRRSATRSANGYGSTSARSSGRRLGSAFDLKRFHMDALNLGSLPLDLLEQELLGTS